MTRPTKLPARADIDGLRGIAVTAVVLFHAAPSVLPGGYFGVDVFFVLSGFLITQLIARDLEHGEFSFAEFYARRVRRIFPALVTVLLGVLALGWFVLLADEYAVLGRHVRAAAGFASNFVLSRETGYFEEASELKPLLHLWSLAIEEQFYVIWPLTLVLLNRLKRSALPVTAVAAAGSFALLVWLSGLSPEEAFFFSPARAWEILLGALLALRSRSWGPVRPGVGGAVGLVGAALVVLSFGLLSKEHPLLGTAGLAPTLGTVLLLRAGSSAWLNRNVLSLPPVVFAGRVSYALYLWHWPLLSFLSITEGRDEAALLRVAAVAVAVVLAVLTTRCIEHPIRSRPTAAWRTFSLVGALLAVGAFGWGLEASNGLPGRSSGATDEPLREPVSTRKGDDSCSRLLHYQPPASAVCLTRTAEPDLLVLGDSHAMAFNSAVVTGRADDKTLLMSAHGWLPFTEYPPGERPELSARTSLANDAIRLAGSLPSVKTVALVTRGTYYFRGGTLAEHQMHGAIQWGGVRVANPRRAFVEGYQSLVKQLLATGKQVVLVLEWAELDFNPNECLRFRPWSFARRPRTNCFVTRSAVEARQAEYRQLIAQLSQENPGLLVYDGLQDLCGERECAAFEGSTALYYDDDHLSIEGSAKLLARFAQWRAAHPAP